MKEQNMTTKNKILVLGLIFGMVLSVNGVVRASIIPKVSKSGVVETAKSGNQAKTLKDRSSDSEADTNAFLAEEQEVALTISDWVADGEYWSKDDLSFTTPRQSRKVEECGKADACSNSSTVNLGSTILFNVREFISDSEF